MATFFSNASLLSPSNCRCALHQDLVKLPPPSCVLKRRSHEDTLLLSRRSWKQSRAGRGVSITASSTVDETALDEVKVKIKVGPVRSKSEKVYAFQKIFPSSSIVVVTLPKPLGIVFVESPLRNAYGKKRIMVGELVAGGNADRATRVAQLFVGRSNAQANSPIINGGVMPGDILRATTTAGVVVDFFGIRPPQRVMDLYIADGRPWNFVMRALTASFVADGDLTLVLERRASTFSEKETDA